MSDMGFTAHQHKKAISRRSEVRYVGPGETRGYPYLICKKYFSCPLMFFIFVKGTV